MNKLPISFVFMTSTKGHYGHDTYLDTLNHYDRQLPLSQYAARVAQEISTILYKVHKFGV